MFPLKLLFYNRGGGIMAKQVQAEKNLQTIKVFLSWQMIVVREGEAS